VGSTLYLKIIILQLIFGTLAKRPTKTWIYLLNAKRKNRKIINMVRSILIEKQLPKIFWAEAARWCVHVLNKCPTAVVPTMEYFRVFGCVAHVHIPNQHIIKLDNKSKMCVLLGVTDESKAYRLIDPISKKIIINTDEIF